MSLGRLGLPKNHHVVHLVHLGDLTCLLCVHLTLIQIAFFRFFAQVFLVASQHYRQCLALLLVQLADPVSHIDKRVVRCQVKHDYDTICIPEKTHGELTESLLAGCVPNLDPAQMVPVPTGVLDCLKIHTCRRNLVHVELFVDVAPEYGSLAY